MANTQHETITASFNDIPLIANPGDSAARIVAYYDAESDRRAEEYRNSPAYAAAEERARIRQQQQDAALADALAVAPAHMTVRDPAAWQRWQDANHDPYGAAILRYAETWARLMEARLLAGDALADIAERTSQTADNEGITGFMYSCAKRILASYWQHGEELRRWHELTTQTGSKATEEAP
jgi:ferric-dicitrate binding protein FerR (iron transport regulator)